MKYKIGDKVKIKTWKEMKKEYGVTGSINCYYNYFFTEYMEKDIKALNCNRILTIKNVKNPCNFYTMKEISWKWSDSMIKCLVKDKSEPITNRFEILDIR